MANYVNYPIGNILRFSIKSYTELFRKAKEGQWFDKNGNIYFHHQVLRLDRKGEVESKILSLVYTKDFLLEKIAEENNCLTVKEITTLIYALSLSRTYFEIQDALPLEEKLREMRDKLI